MLYVQYKYFMRTVRPQLLAAYLTFLDLLVIIKEMGF